MTRRLAKETVYKEGIDVGVDRIYDDFESRTCANCKHWYSQVVDHPNYRLCNNEESSAFFQDCHYGFGCTEFVRKDT